MPKSYQLLCYDIHVNIFIIIYAINPVQDKIFLDVDFSSVGCQRTCKLVKVLGESILVNWN